MIELELLMLGLPKSEIDRMAAREIQITRHLLSYMMRNAGENNSG